MEKETIEQAVQSLNGEEGASIMGNFKNLANWIAIVHLQGTRTPQRVARYLAHLVARLHKAAVEAGKSSHPLPEGVQGLTQMAEDGEEVGEEATEADAESDGETDTDESHGSDGWEGDE